MKVAQCGAKGARHRAADCLGHPDHLARPSGRVACDSRRWLRAAKDWASAGLRLRRESQATEGPGTCCRPSGHLYLPGWASSTIRMIQRFLQHPGKRRRYTPRDGGPVAGPVPACPRRVQPDPGPIPAAPQGVESVARRPRSARGPAAGAGPEPGSCGAAGGGRQRGVPEHAGRV
jgi:hypothetical protein